MRIDSAFGSDEEWIDISIEKGVWRANGLDVRVHINVDWSIAPREGTGVVVFNATDGTRVNITVPITQYAPPPDDFCGSVQGDGYVAIDAAHYTSRSAPGGYKWTEIPHLGRTLSGMTILPPSREVFTPTSSPTMTYDIWIGAASDKVDLILHLSPLLNYLPHTRSALSIQIDEQKPIIIHPVPDNVEDDIVGFLPPDWQQTVADEIRIVSVPLDGGLDVGRHRVRVRGVVGGVVVQRVILDLGGVKGRGKSYLGPPESVRMGLSGR